MLQYLFRAASAFGLFQVLSPITPSPLKDAIYDALDRLVTTDDAYAFNDTVINVQELCTLLAGKKILFVGPESTFFLHTLFLDALKENGEYWHSCRDPHFCTYHSICLQYLNVSKPTHGRLDLAETNSARMRYVKSTTLPFVQDGKDPIYTSPQISIDTGVRLDNGHWIGKARRTDALFINRGPIPAPTFTYSAAGWTFVDDLYANKSTVYLGDNILEPRLAQRIFNAAIHTTLVSFLPTLVTSLVAITEDGVLRQKHIVWHSSWFMAPGCSNNIPTTLQDLLDPKIQDPWAFYYNAQVFIHNHVLPSILSKYNITFLQLTLVKKTQLGDSGVCDGLRHSPRSPRGIELKNALLRGIHAAFTASQSNL